MKHLFIIGNGFDLAHGLPTKYLDYRTFLKNSPENDDFCMNMEHTYGLGEFTDYWWQDFESNLGEGDYFEADFEAMAETAIGEMVTDDGEEMYDVEETLRDHFETMPYFQEVKKRVKKTANWYFYVFCDVIELPEKKEELYKKIECLKIEHKYIHVLQTIKF